MKERVRVVVTGLGAITPVGNDVPTLWKALAEGHSGVGPITHFDASALATRIAAEVKDFDPKEYLGHKEARRLDRFTGEFERQIPILLECNVSGEETKFGWTAWNELEWQDLAQEILPLLEMDNLILRGLMTMAPFFDEPEKARPYFHRLRNLRDYLADKYPQHGWGELSMGMSGDFEVAVEEGATMIRIGTAILGERQKREG